MKKIALILAFLLLPGISCAFFGGGGGGTAGVGISTGTDGTYGWYTSNNTTYSDCASARYNVFWEGGALKSCANNGSKYAITQTIASGTAALGTSAIPSGDHATLVTVSATGVATTDVIDWGFNADPHGVTGYTPSANGMLTIIAYPTAANVNFLVINNTSASITPGAITLNWRVRR